MSKIISALCQIHQISNNPHQVLKKSYQYSTFSENVINFGYISGSHTPQRNTLNSHFPIQLEMTFALRQNHTATIVFVSRGNKMKKKSLKQLSFFFLCNAWLRVHTIQVLQLSKYSWNVKNQLYLFLPLVHSRTFYLLPPTTPWRWLCAYLQNKFSSIFSYYDWGIFKVLTTIWNFKSITYINYK